MCQNLTQTREQPAGGPLLRTAGFGLFVVLERGHAAPCIGVRSGLVCSCFKIMCFLVV